MKAVIESGSQQHVVQPGDQIKVDLLPDDQQTISWQPLLLIDKEQTHVGRPRLENYVVKAKVVQPLLKEPKVVSIRFKAKKRVHKRRGHRQQKTVVEIISISKKAKVEKGDDADNN